MLVLSYLDDIIVLSETFEKHLDDLKAVFERLLLFKLQANRSKCIFACERVTYLGHYISLVRESKLIRTRQLPLEKWFLPKMLSRCNHSCKHVHGTEGSSRILLRNQTIEQSH
ncbi:hypothetical protein AVEN_37008-1 [Araneus ventricosus]|uniref:Reverse transcriptase domain-containing protein n=1 Tax=Araneus ventricosus TaxID=182803 RepID=A0A4Y2KU22_ARAVE|nr:hypothetical protein AVEN_37008-1 [Araneus ventricosus]